MDPFDRDELSQQELDDMLKEWPAPPAPARLRQSLFPDAPHPWWRRMWTASIRVPLPVAGLFALLLAVAAWRIAQSPHSAPAAPRIVRTETVDMPPEPDRAAIPAHGLTFQELRPVAELRPRIIRREDAKN